MEVRPGKLERQTKKHCRSRDEIHEKNLSSYTLGPQKKKEF
jgi:hypothetical protein